MRLYAWTQVLCAAHYARGKMIKAWRRRETLDLTPEVKKLPSRNRKFCSSYGIHMKTFHVTFSAYVVPSKNTRCPFFSQTKAALALLCCQSPTCVPLTAWTLVPPCLGPSPGQFKLPSGGTDKYPIGRRWLLALSARCFFASFQLSLNLLAL